MPIRQLRIYDILVDIIPGIIAIYLAGLIVPANALPFPIPSASGLKSTFLLLGAGFFAGRLIHSVSASTSEVVDSLTPVVRHPIQDYSSRNRIFYELRKSLPIEDDEDVIDDMFDSGWAPSKKGGPTLTSIYPYVDYGIIQQVKDSIHEEYNFNPRTAENRSVRDFAYSKLYGKQTLYARYNIIVTFFRNITVLFWGFFLVTLTQYLDQYGNIAGFWTQPSWVNHHNSWLIPLVFLIVAVITSRQLFKFSTKRNRHLIIDLFQTLAEEAS